MKDRKTLPVGNNHTTIKRAALSARRHLYAVPHADAIDRVVLLKLIDHFDPLHHAAKDRVAGVEVRLRRDRHEILAATGVLAAERHANGAAQIRQVVELVAYRIAGPAFPITTR